jgi:hypothetical protein
MSSLWRILVVLSIALLFTQRVSAHEHDMQRIDGSGAQVVHRVATAEHAHGVSHVSAHCDMLHCVCGHASCCATMCGAHCGALFVAWRFEPWTPDASLPFSTTGPYRAGISHAPPLRPPIV